LIKELSEAIIAGAQEGRDVNDHLLTLAEELPKAGALSESDKALSMEAASWFVGQRVAGAAVYMAEAMLQIGRNLEAAKFLRTVARRHPFNAFKPLMSLKDSLEKGTQHSYSYSDWVEVHNAVKTPTPRGLSDFEEALATKIIDLVPTKMLSLFTGDGVLEERLLETLPDLVIQFVELERFDARLNELSFKFPGRVVGHRAGGRYDFGQDTHDVVLVHKLETYSDMSATLAYAFDRAPRLLSYALHSSRWPPMGQVETPSGSRYVALHGLDPEEIRLMFGSIGLDPLITDISGVLVAETRLEEASRADPEPNPAPVPAGIGPENPSEK
jgi:hypothetical protein